MGRRRAEHCLFFNLLPLRTSNKSRYSAHARPILRADVQERRKALSREAV
jgi:hypothetical protein